MKAPWPQAEDHLVIAPRSEASVLMDLAEGYVVQNAGEYSVDYPAQSLEVQQVAAGLSAQQPYQRVMVTAAEVSFFLREERVLRGATMSPVHYTNCSQQEEDELFGVWTNTKGLAYDADNAMRNASDPEKAARYITWFGPHDRARYMEVQNHFAAIKDALFKEHFEWDCHGDRCGSGWYAYVRPSEEYKIHLCNSFWSAALFGTDSRTGVIIHETSHFDAVAHTNDHAYGYYDAMNLAQTMPAKGVENADNHEYFAENVNRLPMKQVTNPVRVRFTHTSTEIGTVDLPYASVGKASLVVAEGGTVEIETGHANERWWRDRPMILQPINGLVHIGP